MTPSVSIFYMTSATQGGIKICMQALSNKYRVHKNIWLGSIPAYYHTSILAYQADVKQGFTIDCKKSMLKQLFKLTSIELTWIWSARRSATLCARFPPLLMLELIFQLPCFEIPLQCLFFQYLCLRTLNSMSSSVSLSALSSNPICTPDLDQSNLWQAIFLILGQARFQFHLIILHLESFPTSFLIFLLQTFISCPWTRNRTVDPAKYCYNSTINPE